MAVGDGVSALASLAVTFGGFSPTAMDGVAATREHIERIEKAQSEMRKAHKRRRELELARVSRPKSFTDAEGSTWTYVVLDDSFARIERCKHEKKRAVIPNEVNGVPVKVLGSDIFHESEVVEEIVCGDGIEAIAACAFRFLPNLICAKLPQQLTSFSGSWFQQCDALEELVLPGMLDELPSSIFDNGTLRKLHIGRAAMNVKPGAFEKTQLEEVTIDEANDFLTTDGDALYSKDGRLLIALLRPVSNYKIQEGCKALMKKAFMGIDALEVVELPNSLEIVGEYAFSHTGLREVEIPATVSEIRTRAFNFCGSLRRVKLHEGLGSIGDSAFADSALESINVPASVTELGASVTHNTHIVHSGEGVTYRIEPASKTFYFDGKGGLYRKHENGMHFAQLIDSDLEAYEVESGTTVVGARSFAFHSAIREVTIPEGVVEIGASAFRICGKLRRVHIPDSLKAIGKEAFLDTSLESLYLPAGFEDVSEDALVTAGAHRLGEPPSLRKITVHEDNSRYYVQSGLLCKRGPDGDRGIVFNDAEPNVVIPDSVTTIAPLAFCNARNIETFSIGPQLKTIGTGGFSTWSYITDIHIELEEPLEGRTVFDVKFPDTPRTVHEISNSLGGSAWVNVPDIYRHYDNCLAHAHDYNARDNATSAYEQVSLMLGRLKDPILLTTVNKNLFDRIIREHLIEICVDIARHDDRVAIDDLCDFGYLSSDNLEDAIVAVGRLQDAAMSGYLLELKRRRFGRAAFDFDL